MIVNGLRFIVTNLLFGDCKLIISDKVKEKEKSPRIKAWAQVIVNNSIESTTFYNTTM